MAGLLSTLDPVDGWEHPIVEGFAHVMSRIATGTYTGVIKYILLCHRLVPLWKKNEEKRKEHLEKGGIFSKLIRPIAVGELFDKMTALWLFRSVLPEAKLAFKNIQFGVAIRGHACARVQA